MQFAALKIADSRPLRFDVSPLEFNLEYTLNSGQCFSWDAVNLNGLNAWRGVVNAKSVLAVPRSDCVEFYTDLPQGEVERFFALDLPWRDVVKSMEVESEHDEVLLTALKHFPGLRIMRQDPWETIASFICSQNSNVQAIKQRVNLLREKFGAVSDGVVSFPSPRSISCAPKQALANCKLGYRTPYLTGAASMVESGVFSLKKLQGMEFEKARLYLQELPGVGPKVADCICLFSLGHLQAFPVDTHVFQILADFYQEELAVLQGDRKHLRYDELAAFGNRKFGTYCGYSQQYLFHMHRVAREKLQNFYA